MHNICFPDEFELYVAFPKNINTKFRFQLYTLKETTGLWLIGQKAREVSDERRVRIRSVCGVSCRKFSNCANRRDASYNLHRLCHIVPTYKRITAHSSILAFLTRVSGIRRLSLFVKILLSYRKQAGQLAIIYSKFISIFSKFMCLIESAKPNSCLGQEQNRSTKLHST